MNKLSDSAWLMIASLAACVSLLISTPASAGQDTYIVLYKANSVPSNAATALSAAGGKLVWSYREIGVAIAQSSDANFAAKARKIAGVQGAAATSGLGVKVDGGGLAIAEALDPVPAGPITGAPAAGDDN